MYFINLRFGYFKKSYQDIQTSIDSLTKNIYVYKSSIIFLKIKKGITQMGAPL